ncbi:---NA--- [Octopus vulgaris]|uniref:---NA n=1 Tax=Octopus vulgaris TaxID=6645 RepID=A0AA36AFU2_OCTVU|nr:---NA--- [Octopus vulgaris]
MDSADRSQPTKNIVATLKSHGFMRTLAQVERKKREVERAYTLIAPHMALLSQVLKVDKDKEREMETGNTNHRVSKNDTPTATVEEGKQGKQQIGGDGETENNQPDEKTYAERNQWTTVQRRKKKQRGTGDKKTQITCKFFRNGTCWHGETGEGCRFAHPRPYGNCIKPTRPKCLNQNQDRNQNQNKFEAAREICRHSAECPNKEKAHICRGNADSGSRTKKFCGNSRGKLWDNWPGYIVFRARGTHNSTQDHHNQGTQGGHR